jgi:hypothetical protein
MAVARNSYLAVGLMVITNEELQLDMRNYEWSSIKNTFSNYVLNILL